MANGVNIGADTESAPINGSFSLIKSLNLKSAGKTLYEANNTHKVIFIENLLDFSDDFSRSVAKNQFWYLDSDATTVTDGNATNAGMRARALLSHERETVQTIIPLNRYSFFEGLSDRLLPPTQLEFEIVLQDDREMISKTMEQLEGLSSGDWNCLCHNYSLLTKAKPMSMTISCDQPKGNTWKMFCISVAPKGMQMVRGWLHWGKKPEACLRIPSQTRKQNSYTQNPYIFDTFNIDGDDSARLATCRLQYGTSFYPELD